jgi:flagellar biosynthesis protein FlhF
MIIKRYLVRDMNEAMIKIRNELGSEAIIVSNRRIRQKGLRNIFKKKVLEVTAVVDKKNKFDNTEIKEKLEAVKKNTNSEIESNIKEIPSQQENNSNLKEDISELRKMINKLMIESNKNVENQPKEDIKNKNLQVPELTNKKDNNLLINHLDEMMLDDGIIEGFTQFCRENNIYSNINDDVLFQYFQSILEQSIFKEEDTEEKIWTFIGPTGVGKTTTIAKIAAQESINKGKKVGLITLDTYRIGAVEQLKTYANILDIPLEVVVTKLDLTKAIEKLKDCDLILIDSTGRSSLNQEQLLETKELLDSINNKRNILVVSATTRNNDLKTIITNYSSISFDYIILTKMDETKCYGNIFNINLYADKPLLFITTGQCVPDDIKKASMDNLLNYISSEVVI